MPSGNHIIGHLGPEHINLEIYISEKTITQGLCGSFDGDKTNDLFDRLTGEISDTAYREIIDDHTAASWRYTAMYQYSIGPTTIVVEVCNSLVY